MKSGGSARSVAGGSIGEKPTIARIANKNMSLMIQPNQNKLLHALLNSTGMIAQKETLIQAFTAGRGTSSKDLTYQEAGALITHLKGLDSSHKMRRRIISMAHELGWRIAGTKKIDMAAVNSWCQKYGFGHKELNEYTQPELAKLVTQFQNGPYKHYISNL